MHSFRTRARQSLGGGKLTCNLHLSRSEVTVPLKEQELPSKCEQKTLPSKGPCFCTPTLSAGYSTTLFLNTSFTKYFTDLYQKAFHVPHTEILAYRCWHHQLWPILQGTGKSFKEEYWSIENSQWTLQRNTKLKQLLSIVTDAPLLVIRAFFNYKTAGSNTLVCLFSALFLVVVLFYIHTIYVCMFWLYTAIYILAYLRLVAIAVRIHIMSKRSSCATTNKKDSPFILRQFLHRVKLSEMGEDTEEKNILFLPSLITIVILKAEAR